MSNTTTQSDERDSTQMSDTATIAEYGAASANDLVRVNASAGVAMIESAQTVNRRGRHGTERLNESHGEY